MPDMSARTWWPDDQEADAEYLRACLQRRYDPRGLNRFVPYGRGGRRASIGNASLDEYGDYGDRFQPYAPTRFFPDREEKLRKKLAKDAAKDADFRAWLGKHSISPKKTPGRSFSSIR